MPAPILSRLLFPLREHDFIYPRYREWLLTLRHLNIVPLRELAGADTPALGIRHDVDSRLDSALDLARLEHDCGLRATYFVLHTAPYYRHDRAFSSALRTLQDDLGHEVGFHNDLLTLVHLQGVDAREYLLRELDWLRGEGIEITGTAPHGARHCYRLGFHNSYVFAGWDEPRAAFPRTDVPEKLDPADFGLDYDAYHLPYGHYFSDSRLVLWRHTHPSSFPMAAIGSGDRAVALVHPHLWDPGRGAKLGRMLRILVRRILKALGRTATGDRTRRSS